MSSAIGLLRLPWVPRMPAFVRFCLVGLSGYVVNLAVFSLAVGLGSLRWAAAVAAFCVAVANNLRWNRRFTFRARGSGVRFLVVSAAGFVGALLLLALLTAAGLPAIAAQAASIVGVTPLTFTVNRAWAFRA